MPLPITTRQPMLPRPMRNVLLSLLVAAGLLVPMSNAGAQSGTDAGEQLDGRHGRSSLRLELASRTFDVSTGSWTLVVEGTLDSRALCLPVLFDCVVEPQAVEGATLTDVECQSPRWNHLLFFTDRCIKQAFFAGHDQKFEFTYVTDPGTPPDSIDIDVRFGRGFLPVIVRELTSASLTVELAASGDVLKQCPAVTVGAGETFECELTVSSPDPGDAPPAIDTAELTDTVLPAGLVTAASLSTDDANWTCAATACELVGPATIEPGDSVVFTYSATAVSSQDGGTFVNTATLDYGVGSATETATSSDEVTVVGELDTDIEVLKTADVATARPGEVVSWTITATNRTQSATDVVLTDLVSGPLEGLELTQTGGVGVWSCTEATCSSTSMPVGVATFAATGRVAENAAPGTVVNQVDVVWTNDVFGPDYPSVAGAAVEVLGASAVPTPTSVPSRLAFTG